MAGLLPLADAPWDVATLYATDEVVAVLPGMDHDPDYRLYACKCRFDAVNGTSPLVRDDQATTPWQCAGHSPAAFPVTINGIEITRFSDVERIVREHLDDPDSLLVALYERLAGTPFEIKVADVANRLLVDPNPRAKMTALGLYWSHPEAPGARRVLELAKSDRAGIAGTPDPVPIRGQNLEGRLLAAVGKLLTAGVLSDGETLDLLRRDATRRDTSRAVIPVLFTRDLEWLRDRAGDIVAAAPNAVGVLLVHLFRGFGESFDLPSLATGAVGLSSEERESVRKEISLNFMNPLRDRLLAHFGDGSS